MPWLIIFRCCTHRIIKNGRLSRSGQEIPFVTAKTEIEKFPEFDLIVYAKQGRTRAPPTTGCLKLAGWIRVQWRSPGSHSRSRARR